MQQSVKNSPTVVVTGVSSGIGRAVVEQLIDDGYDVFGSVRSEEDASTLADQMGRKFRPLVFDVRDREKVKQAAEFVKSQLNGQVLRGLVNNAGVAAFGPMEILNDDDFDASIDINLTGVRTVTNAFLPLLRGRDSEIPGKIINISSLSGILNTPMNGAYCVSKHALESLADIYRRELLPAGIDVVSVRSGPIQSEIWNKARENGDAYDDVAYQRMATKARRIMRRAEKDALPASAIANTVIDIFAGRKKRVAYHLSKGAWVSRFLAVLPARWADRLITNSLMS
jgi:NAD(P)-dependent dehydrogenase (short-subunit alcohol dehydrogenase family)